MAAVERQQYSPSPAAASTAVASLVTGPARSAEVIGDFPVASYLRVDAAVIALVTPAAVRLPNALVCNELPPVGDGDPVGRPGGEGVDRNSALVGGGHIQLGRTRVSVGRWWDPVPRLPAVHDVRAFARAVDAARSLLPGWPDHGEPAAEQLAAGREALAMALTGEGTPAASADQLVGLGPGLTPAGDDLLAGSVAGTVLFGRALGRASPVALAEQVATAADGRADRTTALAADLVRHAATGAVAEPVAQVCRALTGRGAVEPALAGLLAIGHTSGRDLAEGLLLGATAALVAR